jgi:hypothetical protein
MSIAVDRIQNYYQYSDAEAKFYQVIILIEITRKNVFCRAVTLNFLMQAAKS